MIIVITSILFWLITVGLICYDEVKAEQEMVYFEEGSEER